MNTSTPKLADKPSLANGPPQVIKQRCLEYGTPNLANKPTLADGPPSELSRDALNTSTPKLADEPTLANGPPQNENGLLEENYTKNYLEVI